MSLKTRIWRFFEVIIDVTISHNRFRMSHCRHFPPMKERCDYPQEVAVEMVGRRLMRNGEIL